MIEDRQLKAAFLTDVRPLLAEARARASGALGPLGACRAAGWRAACATERPAAAAGASAVV